MQIGALNFFLVQLDQHVLLQRFGDQEFVFAIRSVAPENILRVGERSDFVHPIEHRLIVRLCIADPVRREYGRCNIFHEPRWRSWIRLRKAYDAAGTNEYESTKLLKWRIFSFVSIRVYSRRARRFACADAMRGIN